jgi:plastocyanin
MKKHHFEITLSLFAAIASSVAATGAFVTGFYQMQAVNLERTPAIHLACRPEYRLAEQATHAEVPEETLLLRPSGGEWLHIGGSPAMPGMDMPASTPEPFARCTLKNFGRLPLLDMHLPTQLFFRASSGALVRRTFVVDLPGLSADAEYEFSLLNGSRDTMRISFDRNVALSRMDGDGQMSEHLFVDAGVPELERMNISAESSDPTGDAAGHAEPVVNISGFAYRPSVLRVRRGTSVAFLNADAEAHTVTAIDRSFDSGTIDPHQRWRRRFDRPGRYRYVCDFHPYMHGEVDVF